MNKAEIQYGKHSAQDRIRVDKYMIPILIKEDAQGTAFEKSLQIYEKEKYKQINELSNIMNCYLKRTKDTEKKWNARQEIALNVLLIKQKMQGEEAKLERTRKRIKNLKETIKRRSNLEPNEHERQQIKNDAINAVRTMNTMNKRKYIDVDEKMAAVEETYRTTQKQAQKERIAEIRNNNRKIEATKQTRERQLQW